MIEFAPDELSMITELLFDNISYYHETLVIDHPSAVKAMAAFDATPAVTALYKLSPVELAKVRKNVEEYVTEYFS